MLGVAQVDSTENRPVCRDFAEPSDGLGILYGGDAPVWSVPLLAAAVLILCELVFLSRGPAPDAAVERPAVTAVLVGRLLVAALLAFAGATLALLAAAVPARHGLATGS